MGLPIAKAIVQAHRGTISPHGPAWAGLGLLICASGRSRTPGCRMTSATILVVDDEPQIRRVMRTTLASHGYTVFEAKNGEEALKHPSAAARPDSSRREHARNVWP